LHLVGFLLTFSSQYKIHNLTYNLYSGYNVHVVKFNKSKHLYALSFYFCKMHLFHQCLQKGYLNLLRISLEVKNAWSFASDPSKAFVVWCLEKEVKRSLCLCSVPEVLGGVGVRTRHCILRLEVKMRDWYFGLKKKELRQLIVGPVIIICLSGWNIHEILYWHLSTFVH